MYAMPSSILNFFEKADLKGGIWQWSFQYHDNPTYEVISLSAIDVKLSNTSIFRGSKAVLQQQLETYM